jgi:hypothetical protein
MVTSQELKNSIYRLLNSGYSKIPGAHLLLRCGGRNKPALMIPCFESLYRDIVCLPDMDEAKRAPRYRVFLDLFGARNVKCIREISQKLVGVCTAVEMREIDHSV